MVPRWHRGDDGCMVPRWHRWWVHSAYAIEDCSCVLCSWHEVVTVSFALWLHLILLKIMSIQVILQYLKVNFSVLSWGFLVEHVPVLVMGYICWGAWLWVMNSALPKKPIIRNDQHKKQKYFSAALWWFRKLTKLKQSKMISNSSIGPLVVKVRKHLMHPGVPVWLLGMSLLRPCQQRLACVLPLLSEWPTLLIFRWEWEILGETTNAMMLYL